jgi:hypothetical protein
MDLEDRDSVNKGLEDMNIRYVINQVQFRGTVAVGKIPPKANNQIEGNIEESQKKQYKRYEHSHRRQTGHVPHSLCPFQ